METGRILHESVLSEEVLFWLSPKPGEIFVDGTLGGGGHAARILEKTGPQGRLIGFDRDPAALEEAGRVLKPFGERVTMICDNFKNIPNRLAGLGVRKVRGVLLDLGVSSMQLDAPDRGFSFKGDGPLDMRMDPSESLTAEAIVNHYKEEALREILWKWGEERFTRKIVRAIVGTRRRKKIKTTSELASVIAVAVPPFYRHGRIHPSTRTFQALRIAVNGELSALEDFLASVMGILDEGGRIVILSFHSLEDRIVKNAFRNFKNLKQGKILTKKPVVPSEEEMDENPRSRSAKLRALEGL